jgi:hypothetical protein
MHHRHRSLKFCHRVIAVHELSKCVIVIVCVLNSPITGSAGFIFIQITPALLFLSIENTMLAIQESICSSPSSLRLSYRHECSCAAGDGADT